MHSLLLYKTIKKIIFLYTYNNKNIYNIFSFEKEKYILDNKLESIILYT